MSLCEPTQLGHMLPSPGRALVCPAFLLEQIAFLQGEWGSNRKENVGLISRSDVRQLTSGVVLGPASTHVLTFSTSLAFTPGPAVPRSHEGVGPLQNRGLARQESWGCRVRSLPPRMVLCFCACVCTYWPIT